MPNPYRLRKYNPVSDKRMRTEWLWKAIYTVIFCPSRHMEMSLCMRKWWKEEARKDNLVLPSAVLRMAYSVHHRVKAYGAKCKWYR